MQPYLTALSLRTKQIPFIDLATDNISGFLKLTIILGLIALTVAVARMVPPFFRKLFLYPRDLTAAIVASLYSLLVIVMFPLFFTTVTPKPLSFARLELTVGGWLHIIVAITAVVTVLVVAVKVRLSEGHARMVAYGQ